MPEARRKLRSGKCSNARRQSTETQQSGQQGIEAAQQQAGEGRRPEEEESGAEGWTEYMASPARGCIGGSSHAATSWHSCYAAGLAMLVAMNGLSCSSRTAAGERPRHEQRLGRWGTLHSGQEGPGVHGAAPVHPLVYPHACNPPDLEACEVGHNVLRQTLIPHGVAACGGGTGRGWRGGAGLVQPGAGRAARECPRASRDELLADD